MDNAVTRPSPSTSSIAAKPPRVDDVDTQEAKDAVQAHLNVKKRGSSRFFRFGFLKKRKAKKGNDSTSIDSQESEEDVPDVQGAVLSSTRPPLQATASARYSEIRVEREADDADRGEGCDEYRWAILYEHQRGLMLFSIPFYSRLTLLPNDPPPFTAPNASSNGNELTSVSLDEYPLPNGTWRWVSRDWMIDMRGDGMVQYDGFEYNWLFRRKNWRVHVGPLGNGGWVRRRRWIRLMMRPAKGHHHHRSGDGGAAGHLGGPSQQSFATTLTSSTEETPSELSVPSIADTDVWRGDEGDWNRCRRVLKRLSRDSSKLELWEKWVGASRRPVSEVEGNGKQRAAASSTSSSRDASPDSRIDPQQRHYIEACLKDHLIDIVYLFIYPASRAQFIRLLIDCGYRSALIHDNGGASLSTGFWSQSQDLISSIRED